jgi:hypothetical protein
VHAVPHTLHMILGRRSALQLQTDKEILKLYQSETCWISLARRA